MNFLAPLVREFCLAAKCYSFNCFITVIPMGIVHNISAEKVNLFNCGEVITKAAAFRGSFIINSVQVCCQSRQNYLLSCQPRVTVTSCFVTKLSGTKNITCVLILSSG